MKELTIDDDITSAARKKAEELGVVRKSITHGEGNVAGFIGEHLAQSVYGGEMIKYYLMAVVLMLRLNVLVLNLKQSMIALLLTFK